MDNIIFNVAISCLIAYKIT